LFRDRFEGKPLKGIALSFGGQSVRGEAIVTREGLEGGGVYALSAPLREAIAATGEATLNIALRPDVPAAELRHRLSTPRGKQSLSNVLRKAARLSPAAIGLLHEAALASSQKLNAMSTDALAALINAVPIRLIAAAPLASAISTAGGIAFGEIDENFMLRRRPGVFAAGEMLDWEAPTGGYLLTACFASGRIAGLGAIDWLRAHPPAA
jgi:predicted flavoprotein YhiN